MSEEKPITESDLHAYLDQETAGGRCTQVEAWLAQDPEAAERLEDYRQIGESLRAAYEPVLSEPVPEILTQRATGERRWRGGLRVAGWVALGLAIGLIGGWKIHDLQPITAAGDPGVVMARRAAMAHATYSPEVRHPVEVGADQEAHLVAWLSKRVGAPLRAPKLEAVGYNLVGGRLLPGENGPVAQFMYQCNAGTRVTLYVKTEAAGNRDTAFRFAREGNVRVFYWVDRKIGYAISTSDISRDDLHKVSNAVYQQLNP